jgi:hypothetical protein
MTKSKTIKLQLVESQFLTRWPCTICGGCTDKVEILCENQKEGIRVCETCLKDGKRKIDARLEEEAASYEKEAASPDEYVASCKKKAAYLRMLIRQLHVPTFAEWKAAMKEVHKAWAKELTRSMR